MGLHCDTVTCHAGNSRPLTEPTSRFMVRQYSIWEEWEDKVSLRKPRHLDTTPSEVLIPVRIYDWDANNMVMQYITCESHQDSRWLTKHAWDRNWHRTSGTDCGCGMDDMMVVITK